MPDLLESVRHILIEIAVFELSESDRLFDPALQRVLGGGADFG
jgi:hypothetical protein